MEDLLITQGLGDAIEPETKEGKRVSSSKTLEEVAEIHKKVKSTIILSLGDSVIREDSSWIMGQTRKSLHDQVPCK